MNCTSKIIQKRFENKFSYTRTKSEAIIKRVLAPFAFDALAQELETSHFVSIFSDASNRKDIKLFPTLVRYFNTQNGISIKIIDVTSAPGETAEIISKLLLKVLDKNNLGNKLVAYCADNANTNFGGVSKKGNKNVFNKLKQNVPEKLIGIGCAAHIIHNTIQTAADLLPVDVDSVINKIYSHFYIFTVRVESLKTFCEEAETDYHKFLSTKEGEINKEWFYSRVVQFYKNCLDYLRLWLSQFSDIGCFEWTDLNQCVEWENVQKTLEFISEHFTANDIGESALFDEVTLIKNYATEQKIKEWQEMKTSIDLRWVEIFQHFDVQQISFALCLPVTNAPTERVFSIINNIWTSEKPQLTVETLKAMIAVRCNLGRSCEEFLLKIQDNSGLLKKYIPQKSTYRNTDYE
ncbi:hypothetical protein ILUMI_15927 [Ignelater luminosus]|uniref:Uncharacterized protein n=1 Tax=Ignelater luminosus TaxID=2038154 RepID=A0A8K0CS55_IGNLU|nr:hypothetical protein ILUMI_15927 [Ignelater luminosus]